MATIENIKTAAKTVKNATAVGENTAARVGGVLSDIADYLDTGIAEDLQSAAESAVASESAARADADAALQKSIESEAAAREKGDAALQKCLDDFDAQKGVENGIAPLDDNARLESIYMPLEITDEVLVFDGFLLSMPTLSNIGTTDAVLFCEPLGGFVGRSGLVFSGTFSNNDLYGATAVGEAVVPYEGKIYIDKSENVPYRWDGTQLVAIAPKDVPASIFNATVEVPISGYYVLVDADNTSTSAVHAAWNAEKAVSGLILSFEIGAGVWKTYQYVGKTVTETNWVKEDNWKDFGSLADGSQTYLIIDTLIGSPTVGTYYTLETAVMALQNYQTKTGVTYAKKGLVISYKTGENTMETKQFQGEVSDFGEVGLWKDFGGGSKLEASDTPEEGGTDAFSTGGAYDLVPTDLKVDTETEGVVKISMVNAKGDNVGNEQQFAVGTGSGESSGAIVTITPEQSPLYAQAGGSVVLNASIRSVTTQGGVEQTNLIERVELYDRDTNQLLETFRLNKASSADGSTYDFAFDLSSYFTQASQRKFKLVAYDDSDHSGSRNINVTAVDVTIKSEQTLNYTSSTAVQVGGSTKTLPMYKFPNNASDKGILCTVEIEIDGEWLTLGTATISDTYSHSITINPQNCCGKVLAHGAYALSIHGEDVASGVVGNYLHTAIMVVDAEKTDRIVVTRWYSETATATVQQYETICMDFAVYDPTASSAEVSIIETVGATSETKQTTTAQRGSTYTYTQRVEGYATDGSVTVELTAKSGTATSQVADFVVSGSLLDIEPVTAQLMFDMDMASRSNADADKSITDGGYTLTVTGANYTTNGFVKDSYGTDEYGTESDTGVMALRIAENVTAQLDYAPFNQAAIETNGLAVQFRIRTKNVADDSVRLISCISGGLGFYVTGKNVVFTTDNAATVAHTITAALKNDSLTDVAIVIEPSSQAPYSGIGVAKMYFDGELIGACYYESGSLARHATAISFDGTDGDLYLYNIRAWETYYSFEQSFNNYLLKMSDTDAMITEYEFNNGVMASQTAENTTKNRPQASELYNQGMPYFVLCKNPDTADTVDNYPNYLEGLDGDKKTTRILDVYAYFPDRPWQDFKAVGVTVSNQGTTSSKRPIKNVKMKFKKAKSVTLLRDRSEFTSDEELAKYDECAKNAAKKRVQPKEGSVPTNIITVKVDYSESGGANNGASTQMYNELQRALGSDYMTPAQNAYTGDYNIQTSIDSIPIAFFRTDQYSSDATSPSYGYFHAKGNWNDDKGDAAVFGFEDCEGYNDGCLNYGDFTELIAAKGQTLDAYLATLDKTEWDTESVYVLSEFCGSDHKVFRYQDGAWVETTGTMTYTNGKWRISGDVVNPVECYELLTYNGMDWFQGVNSVDDMIAAGSDGLPAWLTYYESRYPDDDNLNAAYEDGRKVPYTLYKWLKWCQDCNHNLTESDGNITLDGKTVSGTAENRLKKFQHELHNEANVHSMICYHLFTDYIAAVDQRSKNMMVGFYLDTDGVERMYLNHLYDGDTILGSDNDCGLTIPAELDPNNDPNGYYQGHDSVLFKQLAAADYIWLTDYSSDSDTSDTTKTTTVPSICATMRTTKLSSGLVPFSKDGIEQYWITDRLEKWPKLVSSYDGIRKYIDASKAAANYFYALHGLSIQRLRDYVETRFRYRDGFYGCGDIFSSMIGMRCTGTNMTITITAAKDGFFGIGVDRANTMRESAYLKAGESTTLHSYNSNTGSGIMLYVFGADRIGELDLSNATPKQSGFDISELTLVKKIVLGGEDYTPATSDGGELATLNLGQLPFLEELDVRNFPLTSIDATYCPRLKSVLAGGSNLQTFTPAEESPLATLQLPETMTSLNFVNLPKLTYPSTTLTIDGFSSVTRLQLSGCDGIDAVQLLTDAIDGGARISMISVKDVTVHAGTTVLDALMASGVKGIGSDLDDGCDGLTGTWVLTEFVDDETLSALQTYFPALTIYNAQYTMICQDDTMEDPWNVTNCENGTTGDPDNEGNYAPSGHIQKIWDNCFVPCFGILNTKTGKWEGRRVSDSDYHKLSDGTDYDYTDNSDGSGNDLMMRVRCWYKGINDYKNQKKYTCLSSKSADNEPLSSATVCNRYTTSDLLYRSLEVVDLTSVTAGTSKIGDESIWSSSTSNSTYRVMVECMKQIRWPGVNSSSYGVVFTDADGLIISTFNMFNGAGQFDFNVAIGDYIFTDVPAGVVYAYFTCRATNASEETVVVNSSEIEAIEPDWCYDDFLIGIYQMSVTGTMLPRSLPSAVVKTGTGTSSTSSAWKYDSDGKPTGDVPDSLNYTSKDFQNIAEIRGDGYQLADYEMSKILAILFFAIYGTRDSSKYCGYGSFNTSAGYSDSLPGKITTRRKSNNQVSDSLTGTTTINGNKVLGIESLFGCVYEWTANTLINVPTYTQAKKEKMAENISSYPIDAKWHIYDPINKTERVVQGLTSNGVCVSRTRHGRHCDVIASASNGDSSLWSKAYGDGMWYSASRCRVFGRSDRNGNAYGGLVYSSAYDGASYSHSGHGARLAFRGEITVSE